jgi:Zn-dependent protease with chaperone function
MTIPESRIIKAPAGRLFKLLRWLLAGIKTFCLILLLGWATLAIYYNVPWEWLRLALALVFLIFGIWALWYSGRPLALAVFAALFLGVVVWFSSIEPSHDRPWRPEVAVMPRAIIDGDI